MSTTTIRTTIEHFLNKLGVAFDDVEVHDGGNLPGAKFVIKTKESGILIGNKGENLNALSHLLRRIVEKELPDNEVAKKFFIDVNDYHSKRILEVQRTARLLADRAKTFKHDVDMPPANAYDRMVVHAYLAEDNNIATESQGAGKGRYVVIKYVEVSGEF